MRIVFFGTPQIAVPVLGALLGSGHEIAAVVTQPDRPGGRGRHAQLPPTKLFAQEHGLAVLQPASLRHQEAQTALTALTPEIMVVAAYGKILPPAILEIPPNGVVNIHPSLLPRHRGPSPVANAILCGDETIGISIMLLDEGMDTGPVLAQQSFDPGDIREGYFATTGDLTSRLFDLGAQLVCRTLDQLALGAATPTAQNPALATISRTLTKSDGLLDFRQPAEELRRQVRAYQPWPGAYTHWQGKSLKLLRTSAYGLDASIALRSYPASRNLGQPGLVVPLFKSTPDYDDEIPCAIVTSHGLLGLAEVQLEGKRPVQIDDFLRGYPAFLGSLLPS